MKSLEELMALRDAAKAKMTAREDSTAVTRVVVGMATCGIAAGARPVMNRFSEEIEKATKVVVDHLVNGNPVVEYTVGALKK